MRDMACTSFDFIVLTNLIVFNLKILIAILRVYYYVSRKFQRPFRKKY